MKIRGLYQKRGWYYFQGKMIEGVRPKAIALRTRDLGEAISLALELKERQAIRNHPNQLSKEIVRYLEAKSKSGEHTRLTRRITAIVLNLFCDWVGDPLSTDITRDHIEGWRHHMIEDGNKPNSVIVKLRRLQGLFSWLRDNDRILKSPFEGIKIPTPRKSGATVFCTREQRDQLIAACDREDIMFILMCGFYLGLRIGEITEATPYWFRTPGLIEVSETEHYMPKDKESRIIHYGDRFAEFLEGYGMREPYMLRPDVKRGKHYRRWDAESPFRALTVPLGMRWVTFHVLRHTFATLHIQAGTPLATVARWLGDSYSVTFNHYAAYAPTDTHIKNLD